MSDWNKKIIEEFRANAGKVGGNFAGRTMLLLHTKGARTGQERVNPVIYTRDGENLVVIASKGGAPTNPDWYYNLVAHPEVSVEVGTDQFEARAAVTADEQERRRLYDKMIQVMPSFAEYEKKTERRIPVIKLTPKK